MSSLPASPIPSVLSDAPPRERTVISRGGGWRSLSPAMLWRYREVGLMLALRDLQVRYKQTLLGAGWAIIQPVGNMLVLDLFFGRGLDMHERVGGVSYPVFLFAALLPWTLFTSGVTAAAGSLVNNGHILTKVYFPRLLLPMSATAAPMVDFALAMAVLALLMAWHGVAFTAALLLLPLVAASVLLAVLGVGTLLAAVTVAYRDVRHALPFLLQVCLFATPVIYPSSLLPESWAWVARFNPVAGPVEACRAAVLGQPLDWNAWASSVLVSLVVLAGALLWFAKVERRFADVV